MNAAIEKKLSTLNLSGVGKQIANSLARLEIYTIQDLLFHLPLRYQDRTQIQAIHKLIPFEEAVVEGVLTAIFTPQRGRTKLLCELHDATGKMYLRFFHLLSFQRDVLKPGARLRCYSEARLGPKGFEMIHPEFQVIAKEKEIPIDQYLTPIYPTTEGLTQYKLRKITKNALAWLDNKAMFPELIPLSLLQSLSLPTIKEALQFLHQPTRETSRIDLLENKTLQHRRLIFEELVAHRISLLHMKNIFQSQHSIPLIHHEKLANLFLKQLPFDLTNAQSRVIGEIRKDLMQSSAMLRLVQGDVGSGKTIVAALAMLQAVENGYQAAMMAPTELLAEQHYQFFLRWLTPMNIHVVFLSGNVKGRSKKIKLDLIGNGQAQIVIGTHALFQEEVKFQNLACVVVDEQHRFGVQQRALLRKKATQMDVYPHQLIMTATPIPRTLAMSFYADLDCSIIDELPPGRTPIVTSILANSKRDEVVMRIKSACQQGRQCYWVCPLIDESEALDCQAARNTAETLQKLLPELKIGLIHGRMHANEKEAVMRSFQQGIVNLLVATTVIEVGVDVPNASVIVIENAERLGLSQLHQLRGRVGRGTVASHCVLLYQHPISDLAKERLSVMRATTDGFTIAQKDLELRGPGEILGTRQTGALTFHVADLMRDKDLLPMVHQTAEVIMREHSTIIEPLLKRWLGAGKEYEKI